MIDKNRIGIGDTAFPKGESLQKSYHPKPDYQGSLTPKVEPNQNQNVTPPPAKND